MKLVPVCAVVITCAMTVGCRHTDDPVMATRVAQLAPQPVRQIVQQAKADPPKKPWYTVQALNINGQMLRSDTSIFVYNDLGQAIVESSASFWQAGVSTPLQVPDGGRDCHVIGLNNQGQVLLNTSHGSFLWKEGRTVRVADSAGKPFLAAAINNHGEMVGQVETAWTRPVGGDMVGTMHAQHAHLLRDGRFTDLGAFPTQSDDSVAKAINDHGQVVGTDRGHLFSWQEGKMINIAPLPGYYDAVPVAVNNLGQVAGACHGSEGHWASAYQEPFLWEHGAMRDLGTLPDCSQTSVRGLNDKGDVIGNVYFVPNQHNRSNIPLLWHSGKIYDLNDLVPKQVGFRLTVPFAINNRGQIIARGYANAPAPGLAENDSAQLFLLSPVH